MTDETDDNVVDFFKREDTPQSEFFDAECECGNKGFHFHILDDGTNQYGVLICNYCQAYDEDQFWKLIDTFSE